MTPMDSFVLQLLIGYLRQQGLADDQIAVIRKDIEDGASMFSYFTFLDPENRREITEDIVQGDRRGVTDLFTDDATQKLIEEINKNNGGSTLTDDNLERVLDETISRTSHPHNMPFTKNYFEYANEITYQSAEILGNYGAEFMVFPFDQDHIVRDPDLEQVLGSVMNGISNTLGPSLLRQLHSSPFFHIMYNPHQDRYLVGAMINVDHNDDFEVALARCLNHSGLKLSYTLEPLPGQENANQQVLELEDVNDHKMITYVPSSHTTNSDTVMISAHGFELERLPEFFRWVYATTAILYDTQ